MKQCKICNTPLNNTNTYYPTGKHRVCFNKYIKSGKLASTDTLCDRCGHLFILSHSIATTKTK